MGMLIKNEFYKLKREWFMAFLLLLSLLPILTGGAGAVFNNSTKSLADLFFFMNNQFSMFFPMVIFILIGSLFYQEYKNKTYINWITYGFSKKKLFLSKVAVSIVIGIGFAAILFITFGLLVAILNGTDRLIGGGISLFLNLAIGFGIESCVIVLITTCLGAIVINLSRNIIVTSVVGVIYGFASCLFIGSESGFLIPGSFAYRVSMFFSDKSTYYEVPISATIGGCISIVFCFIVLFLVGLIVFSHKKKIEILNNVLKNKFGIEGKDKIQELIDIYQDYVNKEVEKEKKYNRVIVAICSALAGVLTISFENMEQIGISFNSWIYLAVLLISFAALATLIIYSNTFLDTLKVKYEMLIKDLKELLLIKY